MAAPIPLYQALDAASALLALIVTGFFGLSWVRARNPSHLLFSAGFALVGISFAATTPSQFDLGRIPEVWDAVRISGQLGGALVLLFAYVSARRHGAARPWIVLGWSVAGIAAAMAILYVLIPPYFSLPSLEDAFVLAHGLMVASYVGCAALASSGYRQKPTLDRALVPAAFVCWAATKYTWLLVDLSAGPIDTIILLVFMWRFAALILLLLAIRLPPKLPKVPREVGHASP